MILIKTNYRTTVLLDKEEVYGVYYFDSNTNIIVGHNTIGIVASFSSAGTQQKIKI